MSSEKKIAILASGSGSNAEQITNFCEINQSFNIRVDLILTNNSDAFVIERAKRLAIDYSVFDRASFSKSNEVVSLLMNRGIDYVILAGFLWLVPQNLIDAFPDRIINIHPALLPKYGGKGMYGSHVHSAVVENGEFETGITIHLVDEHYDNGKILSQEKCKVDPLDTAEMVADKIHLLEKKFFPQVIVDHILKKEGNLEKFGA